MGLFFCFPKGEKIVSISISFSRNYGIRFQYPIWAMESFNALARALSRTRSIVPLCPDASLNQSQTPNVEFQNPRKAWSCGELEDEDYDVDEAAGGVRYQFIIPLAFDENGGDGLG